MKLFNHNKISVRLLSEGDASKLVKWLSDPVVLEYYEGRDRPHDLELVRQHFYERVQEITQCVVDYDGVEIGYIQFYLITDDERNEYGYTGFKGSIYGLDQFIGETHYWNKGIGTELIVSMVKYLIAYKDAGKIVMDPQVWNTRAVRVYEKSGFVKKKLLPEHEWHEGKLRDCWLMEYEVRVDKEAEIINEDREGFNDALNHNDSVNGFKTPKF
jgi:aminoglycoside 6'-N-acetyltransferase